jgi:hypothetical protein
MLKLRWDDHAIVMSTEVRQEAQWFKGILAENEDASR